jgi:hypothetical protein
MIFRNMLIPLGGHPSKRQSQPREYSHRICAFMRYDSLEAVAISGWPVPGGSIVRLHTI